MGKYTLTNDTIKRLGLVPQEEGGLVGENHYFSKAPGRAESGSAYYYIYSDTATAFHKLDCDEYWTYHTGADLEMWLLKENGRLDIRLLGISEKAVPCIFVERGTIFGTRHKKGCTEGTLVSNITVPRFDQSGFTVVSSEDVIRLNSDCKNFYE